MCAGVCNLCRWLYLIDLILDVPFCLFFIVFFSPLSPMLSKVHPFVLCWIHSVSSVQCTGHQGCSHHMAIQATCPSPPQSEHPWPPMVPRERVLGVGEPLDWSESGPCLSLSGMGSPVHVPHSRGLGPLPTRRAPPVLVLVGESLAVRKDSSGCRQDSTVFLRDCHCDPVFFFTPTMRCFAL